jgi:pimeloyl-ACP methyl ester carboxylesterase
VTGSPTHAAPPTPVDSIGVALLHGGFHASWCWDGMVPFVNAAVVAIDLPGRDGDPADVDRITAQDWTNSAVEQIEELGTKRVILVAHSLGGVTALNAAKVLGDRLSHLVMVAALAPAEGQTAADVIVDGSPMRAADLFDSTGAFVPPPIEVTRMMLANDLPPAAGDRIAQRLHSEPRRPLLDPFSYCGFPDVPITYVRTARDNGVTWDKQERMISHLPKPPRVLVLEAGHNVMVSQPQALAGIVNDIVAHVV